MKLKAFLMLALLCVVAQGSWAQTSVSDDKTLRDAITDGANIRLATDIQLSKFLNIEGVTVTIDLNGHRLYRNLSSSSDDGHIFWVHDNGNLTIEDSSDNHSGTIEGGKATNGGGINVWPGCTLTVTGGTFKNNSASNNGGAIFVRNGANISISNASFIGNSAADHGGAVWNNGTFAATDCTFENNTASDVGGIYNSVYTENDVTYAGSATLKGCTFTGNTGTTGAGALANAVGATVMTIENCTIQNNTAASNGGGIWNGGTLNMKGEVTVTGNKKASGVNHNVFLKSGTVITILEGSLNSSSRIGVDMETTTGTFTSGFTGSNHITVFTADRSAVVNLALDDDGQACLTNKVMKYYDSSVNSGSRMKTAENVTAITSNTTSLGTIDQTSWYYVSGTIENNHRIEVNGTVNLILADGCLFKANAGLRVEFVNKLNIYAQSAGDGCGKLEAYYNNINDPSYGNDAAIGGNGNRDKWDKGYPGGVITFYGGDITAPTIGGGNGSERGSGYSGGKGGTIIVYGGCLHVDQFMGGGIGKRWITNKFESTISAASIYLSWANSSDRIYVKDYHNLPYLRERFTDGSNSLEPGYTDFDLVNDKTLLPDGDKYTVNIVGDDNCLTHGQYLAYDEVTLAATNGYRVSAIKIKKASDGSDVPMTINGNGTWSFFMPSCDVNVTPTIAEHDYYLIYNGGDVNISATETLNQEGVTSYKYGQTISFTLVDPEENYELQNIDIFKTGDETDIINVYKTNDVYTFTMPEHDVTLSPSWRIVAYDINKSDDMDLYVSEGGTTTINGHVYYKENATVTVAVNIPAGHVLSGFSVNNDFRDGAEVPFTDNGNGTFSFTMPNGNVTISAIYQLDTTHLRLLTGTNAFNTTGQDRYENASNECSYSLLDGKYSTSSGRYTKWCIRGFESGGRYNSENPAYVEFKTEEPVIPKFYTLITGNDNTKFPGRNPKDWTMKAKLYENDEWTPIATVTDDAVLQDVDCTTYLFAFANNNDNAYQYFHFEITSNQGDTYMQLSELQMWVKDGVVLSDYGDNIGIINNNCDKVTNVTLAGRKLWKDGSWNTLCLPFDVSTTSGPLTGYGVVAMTLDTETSSFNDGKLTLNFTDVQGATIPAGTPFIIKWAKDTEHPTIDDPTFTGVTISNAKNNATVADVLTFTGNYATVYITDEEGDNTILYFGAGDMLYYPDAEMAIGSCRAYFQLQGGLTAGEPTSTGQGIKAFVLNFGVETGIHSISEDSEYSEYSDAWFTLDGRRLGSKPDAAGLYIHRGRKVMIK